MPAHADISDSDNVPCWSVCVNSAAGVVCGQKEECEMKLSAIFAVTCISVFGGTAGACFVGAALPDATPLVSRENLMGVGFVLGFLICAWKFGR